MKSIILLNMEPKLKLLKLDNLTNSAFTLAAGHGMVQYGMVRYVFGVCLH